MGRSFRQRAACRILDAYEKALRTHVDGRRRTRSWPRLTKASDGSDRRREDDRALAYDKALSIQLSALKTDPEGGRGHISRAPPCGAGATMTGYRVP
jgi:hypothetical protein